MSRGKDKGRSITTYRNKLKKLQRTYNNLFRASKKAEEKGKARSFYFHKHFPTFEKYKETIKIKEASR